MSPTTSSDLPDKTRQVKAATVGRDTGGKMTRHFVACKQEVYNRGVPPDSFLNELIDWSKSAPESIFEKNTRIDIYSNVSSELGPWQDLFHRKAVMLEVLRVLGGFESSWNWNAGVDGTNPNSNTPCTEEAGLFQCSGNSMSFSAELMHLLEEAAGNNSCESFIFTTKSDHRFAIEYCARLLRFTVNHHGPIKGKHINAWLRRDSVEEFIQFIKN